MCISMPAHMPRCYLSVCLCAHLCTLRYQKKNAYIHVWTRHVCSDFYTHTYRCKCLYKHMYAHAWSERRQDRQSRVVAAPLRCKPLAPAVPAVWGAADRAALGTYTHASGHLYICTYLYGCSYVRHYQCLLTGICTCALSPKRSFWTYQHICGTRR